VNRGIKTRAAAALVGVLALGASVAVTAAPAGAATWEDDLVVTTSYFDEDAEELTEARCRVDVYPVGDKNLPGYVTVEGKVRCNHRLFAGGEVWLVLGSHDGDVVDVTADLRRIRTGSSPDRNATFKERVYVSPADYREAGGSGTWAVRNPALSVDVHRRDGNEMYLFGERFGTVERFQAY
jgi:hypothetical protein